MNLHELFNGVAVIIDDEINKPNANIGNLIKQIEADNIPALKYEAIPSEETIKHFQNICFLLLDWRLVKEDVSDDDFSSGVTLPGEFQKYKATINIEFIRKLKQACLCPIFIFTNEVVSEIEETLFQEGLYQKDKPNHIFIKSKSELKGKTKLLRELEKWLQNTPSIYVLKEWEFEYQKSKNKMFSDFQELSPVWPKIMWKNFDDDGINKSLELGELISQNLHTRMSPFSFSDKLLTKRGCRIDKEELKKVLEGERFLDNAKLPHDSIFPGDIFKKSGNYYINIRAACDLIPGRTPVNSSLDNIDLYLLKGQALSDLKSKKIFNKKYGFFTENNSQSIIFPIHDGKIIDFRFKELKVLKWSELKDKRIGRLLPPHINKIQQKYAHYMQRQGVPRIPHAAIS